MFRGLLPEQLAWLTMRMRVFDCAAGSPLLTMDQPGEVVYVVLRGTVKIHMEQLDGTDVALAILGPGDTVGEMSLIDSVGRSASVVTLEDSRLMWMDKRTFQEAQQRFPTINDNLVRILSGRVRMANEQIQALASLDVYGRVARQLLAFGERYGSDFADGSLRISIRLTQSELADLVGASRKRVNQVMVSYRRRGLLDVDDAGHVLLMNRSALAKMCR
ncbi:MAG: cAMP-activated global transcriptional regulator CRP [Anaerolineales bacterium]